ncbi:galactokinase [Rothia sp. CCM 9418]|uniref:galactokinase n=1 Tax=Rothia sp. CCM 9418 TaxID=3402661 RepID=UPI003AEAD50A
MSTPHWITNPTQEDQIHTVVNAFIAEYGYEPAGVWAAPGRVNLLGEHVDYAGGTVMPLALPHRTLVAASPRQDGMLRAVSDQADGVEQIALKDIAPGALSGWFTYVAGVPWGMKKVADIDVVGADLAITSAVPVGGGLSSSAALECSVALALDELTAQRQETAPLHQTDEGRATLAQVCIAAENNIAGAQTGGMDQSISLRALEGSVLTIDCRDFSTKPLTVDVASAGLALLVIDTKAPHQLADGQYAHRRAICELAAEAFNVDNVRNAMPTHMSYADAEAVVQRWEESLSNVELPEDTTPEQAIARIRHVVHEMVRVQECIDIYSASVTDESWKRLGELLSCSHASLRDDYEVTVPQLDVAVEAAEHAGALGARMVGGGFGGSVLALVPQQKIEDIAEAVVNAFEQHGFGAPAFVEATPGAAAIQVK